MGPSSVSLGIAGLVVAGLGAASILTGLGLFVFDHYKANENKPNSNLEFEPSLSKSF